MSSQDPERSKRRPWALLPLVLLAGLVALQVQQAFRRIGVLRAREHTQFLNAVERMNTEVASALEGDIALGVERARTLAQVLEYSADDRDQILQGYRESNPEQLELRAIVEEVEPGNSVPPLSLEAVEWHAQDQVLLFRAASFDAQQSKSPIRVELTLRADPFFSRVTNFQPIEGVGTLLLDGQGIIVSADSAAIRLGLGVGQDLGLAYGERSLARIAEGAERVRATEARLLVSGLGPGDDLFRLVSVVTDSALAEKAAPGRHEARAVVLTTIVYTVGLLLAGMIFYRSNLRERALRERGRELERERVMAERLGTSERLSALGLLTAGVAHEINNPLEGIGNYLSLLGQEDLSPGKRRQYVERTQQGLGRIRSIVRDLLGFARPGTKSGLFDLRAAVLGALHLARLAPDVKGCELVLEGLGVDDADDSRPALVQGDVGGLEQVVLNLLLNAGRATGGSGRIQVTLEPGDEQHVLWVSDDGVGIAPEDLPRLFDPFFTRSAKSSLDVDEERKGTGLGLSISYSIVQSHGGELVAKNRPEGGAEFEMRLPSTSEVAPQ
ncbi:MAG: signal transduction histidine kinase [Planctomycetota bacterium]